MTAQRSVLYRKFQELKARFKEINGWELPSDFGSTEEEWKAVRKNSGLLDLTHRGKILVQGNDRIGFIHNMVSNDIKSLKTGAFCYATLLTPKGKIITDLNIFVLDNSLLIELDQTLVAKVIERLSTFIITEDVTLKDVTLNFGLLSLQGPDSGNIISQISSGFKNNSFEHDRTGSSGFDLWTSIENLEKLWDEIQKIQPVPPVGFSAFDILRIEAGIPVYGQDLDENTIPNEAHLERAISWTKGCYPGQEIVARIKYLGGVQRILTGILVEGDETPRHGDKIFSGGNGVGQVTSAIYSFHLKRPIAMGFLRTSAVLEGDKVEIHSDNKIMRGEVSSLPFYKGNASK